LDPLTQGVLGAALPQSLSKKKSLIVIGFLGFLSGLAPDLDVLIRSENDPLLFLEFHRQFTHSLIFIPVGGFICASFLFFLIAKRFDISFKDTWIYSTLGYGTHGLLDACTSYGTLLFWPFSQTRIAWNNISIIDPLFTIPILILIVMAGLKQKRIFSVAALIWAVFYLSLGIYQKSEAIKIGKKIAKDRGHSVIRIDAKPSIGNLILWKSIYETRDKFFIDAIRLGWNPKIFNGESINKINVQTVFPWLMIKSQQAKDIKRFKWFSDGYIAINPKNKNQILDIRYSTLPNEIGGLWGIELSEKKANNSHVKYITNRTITKERFKQLKKMLFN
jgi:inner membrane protein|tara:strand:- start:2606 stop:3604 length:999 start_codon:yes stop_codon:yes gene_type:complete